MGALEIILLAAGAVIFIASFCIPVKQEKLKEETRDLAEEEIRVLVAEEVENVRGKLTEISEEEMRQQIENSERSMERISNEKIMAVNEYSDTVLEEIHKNHEEVVFLYDMLKNKKESLSESYGKVDQNLQELLQQVKDSEITVQENLKEISGKLKEFEEKQAELEAVSQAAERQKTTAGRRTRKIEEKADEAVNSAAETVQTPEGKAQEETVRNESPAFEPFTPEKIKAAPKKRVVRKAAEKQQQSVPAAPAAENEDLMLLLSDTMESSVVQNSNERILELHKAGKSNMAIARELGLGIGEVKLVIDLYEGMR